MGNRTFISFDWAIKKLLRHKANFAVLEGFISTVINKPVKIDTIMESESNKSTENDKMNRCDILAKDSEGAKYIIEVQYDSETAYFHRMLFDVSKHVIDHMKSGSDYDKIKKVYCINIVHFNLGCGDDYAYIGSTDFVGIHTKSKLELSPYQQQEFGVKYPNELYPEYILLKVKDFDKHAVTPLDEWISFLKTSEIPESASAPGLLEAREVMSLERMDIKERKAYERYLEEVARLRDIADTARGEAILEGEERGIAIGEKQARKETAYKMKAKGYPIEEIAELTGLSIDEIVR